MYCVKPISTYPFSFNILVLLLLLTVTLLNTHTFWDPKVPTYYRHVLQYFFKFIKGIMNSTYPEVHSLSIKIGSFLWSVHLLLCPDLICFFKLSNNTGYTLSNLFIVLHSVIKIVTFSEVFMSLIMPIYV